MNNQISRDEVRSAIEDKLSAQFSVSAEDATNEQIFQEQIDLFSFFFGTDKLTDEQRWDFIEDYFTGMGVDDLKKKFVSL